MAKRFSHRSNQNLRFVRNQLSSLVLYEQIETTVARARILKDEMQRLIGVIKSKDGFELKREMAKTLYGKAKDKAIDYKEKFESVSMIKTRTRRGDCAPLAIIRLNLKSEKTKEESDPKKLKSSAKKK